MLNKDLRKKIDIIESFDKSKKPSKIKIPYFFLFLAIGV